MQEKISEYNARKLDWRLMPYWTRGHFCTRTVLRLLVPLYFVPRIYLTILSLKSKVAYNNMYGATPCQNFDLVYLLGALLQHTCLQES